MSEPTTLDCIKKIIIDNYGEVDPENITDDARFHEDLGFDSLDSVEFTMMVEDVFNITITDEEATSMKTLSEAAVAVDAIVKNNKENQPNA